MLKEKLIQDYEIFVKLRDKYPEHRELIGELMKYALTHYDAFDSQTYLEGIYNEDSIKLIFEGLNESFEDLNLSLIVSKVIHSTLRGRLTTIVELIPIY